MSSNKRIYRVGALVILLLFSAASCATAIALLFCAFPGVSNSYRLIFCCCWCVWEFNCERLSRLLRFRIDEIEGKISKYCWNFTTFTNFWLFIRQKILPYVVNLITTVTMTFEKLDDFCGSEFWVSCWNLKTNKMINSNSIGLQLVS